MLVDAGGQFAWLLAGLHVVGLAATWLARAAEGTPRQRSCHRLVLLAVGIAGIGTIASAAFGPGYCLTSGASLAAMLISATLDGPARLATR